MRKWEKLLHCKSFSYFFNKKYWHIWDINVWNFNETLTNDVFSFDQPGSVLQILLQISVKTPILISPPVWTSSPSILSTQIIDFVFFSSAATAISKSSRSIGCNSSSGGGWGEWVARGGRVGEGGDCSPEVHCHHNSLYSSEQYPVFWSISCPSAENMISCSFVRHVQELFWVIVDLPGFSETSFFTSWYALLPLLLFNLCALVSISSFNLRGLVTYPVLFSFVQCLLNPFARFSILFGCICLIFKSLLSTQRSRISLVIRRVRRLVWSDVPSRVRSLIWPEQFWTTPKRRLLLSTFTKGRGYCPGGRMNKAYYTRRPGK